MKGHIAHCKHAIPTLRLEWPLWLDAWSWPWTCTKDDGVKLVSHTEGCHNCPHWEMRTADFREPPAPIRDAAVERD